MLPEFLTINGKQISLFDFMMTPCKSKKDLHNWIKIFTRIDFPDASIDSGSNCSPMDMIWWIYNQCVINPSANRIRALFIANRAGFKTLGMSVAELLVMVHGKRDAVHIGAIEAQAKRCYSYFTKYLRQTPFKELLIKEPTMEKTVLKDGLSIEILPCTQAAVNGPHVPYACLDEVDLVKDLQAYRDIAGIPCTTKDGFGPVVTMISTMKTLYGLVAQEKENAHKTNTNIFSWNIIDLTKKCPDSRSLTEIMDIYVNFDTLEAVTEEEYFKRSQIEQIKYQKLQGYKGCITNCKMFAACLGSLKRQTSTSTLLHNIEYTQEEIFSNPVEWTISQLLCRKHSMEGIIYVGYSYSDHVKSYRQMWEIFTGEKVDKEVTFEELHEKFKQHGIRPFMAIDFGDQLAVALLIYIDGKDNVYVLKERTFSATDDNEMTEWLRTNWAQYGVDMCYPDIANPSGMRLLINKGFACSSKVSKDVYGGINTVRSFLRVPGTNRPRLFIHSSCGNLIWEFPRYHKSKRPNGQFSEDPEKVNDHSLDGLRYLLHTRYGGVRIIATTLENEQIQGVTTAEGNFIKTPTAAELAQHLGIGNFVDNREVTKTESNQDNKDNKDSSKTGGEGGFNWSF